MNMQTFAEYPQLLAGFDQNDLAAISRNSSDREKAAVLKSKGVLASDSLIEGKPAIASVMSKISQLPDEIAKGLAAKTLRIMDSTLYNTVSANAATSVSIFSVGDDMAAALCNVKASEVPEWTVVYGIQLLSGVNASKAAAAYAAPAADVLNGEYMFSCDNAVFFDREPTSNFGQSAYSPLKPGYFPLANPIVLKKTGKLKFDLKFAAALAANTNLRLALYCGVVVKTV